MAPSWRSSGADAAYFDFDLNSLRGHDFEAKGGSRGRGQPTVLGQSQSECVYVLGVNLPKATTVMIGRGERG